MAVATAALTEITGSGEALLLVHGLGGTSNVWLPQARTLSRHFLVVRPELSGSGRAPLDGSLSTEGLVAELVWLMDELELDSAHLAGHSYGALICQHLAARHPERVDSLFLLGAFREPPDPARRALRERAAKARVEGLADIADEIVEAGTSAETKAARPEVAAFVRELIMRQVPSGYAATCESLADSYAADLAELDCPTLVLTGDEDNTAPPSAALAVAEAIPEAAFEILPRCGHWATLERPREVTSQMVNFLLG